MSFRDNLQHLRAAKGMTQEQLAMLVGVSRQAVTKWESERGYPEMDKLLKMCAIFDCTLDELVQGDLTARPSACAPAMPGPVQDVCGYDAHMLGFARRTAWGVAAILLGVGAGIALNAFAVANGYAADGTVLVGMVFLGVVAGLSLLIPAALGHSSFVKAHPYIEDFYSVEEKDVARRNFAAGIVVGVACILAGVFVVVAFEEVWVEEYTVALLLGCIAVGVWLIVHHGIAWSRVNVAEYNKDAAEELEIDDIVNAKIDEARREALLGAKAQSDRKGAVCGAIMLVATIVGLLLLFVPVATSPKLDAFDPVGTTAPWFWLAWPVGGMLCGAATLLMDAFGRK